MLRDDLDNGGQLVGEGRIDLAASVPKPLNLNTGKDCACAAVDIRPQPIKAATSAV
jgi:hypothetical protein